MSFRRQLKATFKDFLGVGGGGDRDKSKVKNKEKDDAGDCERKQKGNMYSSIKGRRKRENANVTAMEGQLAKASGSHVDLTLCDIPPSTSRGLTNSEDGGSGHAGAGKGEKDYVGTRKRNEETIDSGKEQVIDEADRQQSQRIEQRLRKSGTRRFDEHFACKNKR